MNEQGALGLQRAVELMCNKLFPQLLPWYVRVTVRSNSLCYPANNAAYERTTYLVRVRRAEGDVHGLELFAVIDSNSRSSVEESLREIRHSVVDFLYELTR
jgi:hypothetical protein